jgi:hypothetical protein
MTMESLTVRSKRDIIDFVNSHSNPKRGSIMVYIALGGIFIDAYDFTSLGIGVDTLTRQLSLTPFQVGSVTAIMALGALIGAFGGGYVTDRLGRFKTFIIDLICLVVAAIGSALAWDLWSLLFFRFLLGVGVGMDFPVALSFIAEFTNSQTKGKYVNLWQAMWYIAAASTGLFTLPLYFIGVGDNLWRWAVGLGAVWALIILILRLIYIDESPMWAAHRQGLREAANILEKNYDVRVTVAPAEEETSETRRRVSLGSIFQKGLRAHHVNLYYRLHSEHGVLRCGILPAIDNRPVVRGNSPGGRPVRYLGGDRVQHLRHRGRNYTVVPHPQAWYLETGVHRLLHRGRQPARGGPHQ